MVHSIENGFWDCTGIGENVSSMTCKAKCISGELNKPRASIKVQCKTTPVLQLKKFTSEDTLSCVEPIDPCVEPVSQLNIIKGSLELISSSAKKGNQYTLICINGQELGSVKCKKGVVSSKIPNFKHACDRFICNEDEATTVFYIGEGDWNCKQGCKFAFVLKCECDANATALRNLDANAMRMRRIFRISHCRIFAF